MMDNPDKNTANRLIEILETRTARVCVVGLGYVGLPMALAFSEVGFPVCGFDVDSSRAEQLSQGKSYISDVSDDQLQASLSQGTFRATADPEVLAQSDVILICVPTPLSKSKDPDLRAILSATGMIADRVRPGQLIVLESTTYPGTTEEVLLPRFLEKGLEAGKDFFLAFSPERIDPGNTKFSIQTIPKVVGGVTQICTEVAAIFYRQAIENVVKVSSPSVAETSKLLENTFRSVNIALVNEMALICERLDINIWDVIDAAATKPFGYMAHYPGPGIGGHCIPLDPHYLSWKARLNGYEPKFISLATEINSSMPHHVVAIVARALNDRSKSIRGSKILILGVAYKPNVADCRESPGLEIIEILRLQGACLSYSDPYILSLMYGKLQLELLKRSQQATAFSS
jgi:UDP-N-acetyl-D-glucosamine dehydrogenase